MKALETGTGILRKTGNRLRCGARVSLVLVATLSLGGCTAIANGAAYVWDNVTPGIDAEEVVVKAELDANNNSPVAIDVVIAFDEGLLERLGTLSAAQWFNDREQFLRDEPQSFSVTRFEVVPGQRTVYPLEDPVRFKAEGGYIFINYPPPGDHRLRIDTLDEIRIRLLKDRFLLEGTGTALLEQVFKK